MRVGLQVLGRGWVLRNRSRSAVECTGAVAGWGCDIRSGVLGEGVGLGLGVEG